MTERKSEGEGMREECLRERDGDRQRKRQRESERQREGVRERVREREGERVFFGFNKKFIASSKKKLDNLSNEKDTSTFRLKSLANDLVL